MSHPALAPVFKRFKNFPLSSGSRGEFYEIHRCFVEAARGQGFQKTVQDAAHLIAETLPSGFWSQVASRHSETFDALHRVARTEPRSFIDDAISCLASERAADAVLGLGSIHENAIGNFAKYRSLVEQGPDRGMAIWQVMNPFYYIWSAMRPALATVSDQWRSAQFDNTGNDVAKAPPSEIDDNHRTLIALLREQLGAEFLSTARILECGCGDGQTADLLVRHLGVRPGNYRAFDLHPARVETTKSIVAMLAHNEREPAPLKEGSVFVFDALAEPSPDQLEKLSAVDLLISASFTNVFPDQQLAVVLKHLLAARPAFIVDISVTTSWGLCVGRADPTPFYRDHGYHVRASAMESPALAANEAHRIWMPERYWSNRSIHLYQRS